MNAYQNWKKKIETHHPSWYSRARLAYSTSLLEFGSLGSYQWDTNTIPIFPPFSWHYISKHSKEIMELLYIEGLGVIYKKISSANLDAFSEFFKSSKMRKDLVMSNFVRLFGWISWARDIWGLQMESTVLALSCLLNSQQHYIPMAR